MGLDGAAANSDLNKIQQRRYQISDPRQHSRNFLVNFPAINHEADPAFLCQFEVFISKHLITRILVFFKNTIC